MNRDAVDRLWTWAKGLDVSQSTALVVTNLALASGGRDTVHIRTADLAARCGLSPRATRTHLQRAEARGAHRAGGPAHVPHTLYARADAMTGPVPYAEIKERISTEQGARIIGLQKHSEAHKYACPWCETSRSFHAYADGFYCHACDTRADVIDVAAAVWRVSGADAARKLADLHGIRPDPLRTAPARRRPKKPKTDPEADRTRCEVLGDLPDLLTLSPRGRTYLEGRGLDADYCFDYGLRSIDTRREFEAVQAALVARHGRKAWDLAGLSSWWMAWPFVVLPYWSPTGRIVAVRARSLEPAEDRPKYLSPKGGASRIAFNMEALEALHAPDTHPTRVIVCEGELDALALHQEGEVAVGLPGATPSADLLADLAAAVKTAPSVAIATDPDEAGDKSADRIVRALIQANGPAWFMGRVTRWRGPGDVTETLQAAT